MTLTEEVRLFRPDSPSTPACRRWISGAIFLGLMIGSLWATVAVAGGHPVPLALPGNTVPWTTTAENRQHRALEAESKARAMSAAKTHLPGVVDKGTLNMEMYNVGFYDLVIDLDPVAEILTGTTRIRAEVTGASLGTMDLDLDLNMYVPEARAGGVVLAYSRLGGVLTLTLDRTYTTGEILEVEIDYYGNPAGDYFGWASYGGQPLVWTLSEPYGARGWWPCKDLNTDKADSVALHVTVDDNLVVASNGTLDETTVPAPGKKTYHWTERYPVATYLISVTAHPFATFSDTYVSAAGDSMPLDYFVVPDQLANATAGYSVVGPMLTAFAGLFGEYPFIAEKYGHAQFLWGGGMEHQTCSSLYYNHYGEGLISHELAHQWFGDLITCADFSHIWLNEGFATWSEAYWLEQSVGAAAYLAEMDDARYLGPGTIFVENPNNFYSIFDFNLSYQKAIWVPHMLRHLVGEADFAAGLDLWRASHGFSGATTEDFQAVFESVSGLDLQPFFRQWIYGQYYPAYQMSWTTVPEGGQTRVMVKIAQTQSNTGLFTMPLDVRVTTNLGATTFVVQNNQAEQWCNFVVDGEALNVELDPDGWVLCTVTNGGVSEVPVAATVALELRDNVPNPFNPATDIRFHLATDLEVRLDIHDVSGRLVKKLVAGSLAAGEHRVRWDGRDSAGRAAASGTYFARLQGAGLQQVRALTLVR